MNALFFNLHNHVVEDYTGLGLRDLRSGVLRTPLDAEQTLIDDPLRVLRGVRFATTYHLTPEPRFLAAAAKPAVRNALQTKVTQGRARAAPRHARTRRDCKAEALAWPEVWFLFTTSH